MIFYQKMEYSPKRRAAITAQSHNLLENVWPISILVRNLPRSMRGIVWY